MRALSVRNLVVRFPGQERPALEDVSFDLEEGELAVIVGPNGCGKTTLLRAVLGLLPYTGEILAFEEAVASLYGKIGYVPQRLPFDPTLPLTAREAIRMPIPPGDTSSEAAFAEAVETLGVARYLDEPLAVLSGGELKRALLARALVMRPRLLVLDEPEASVDVAGEETLYDLLEKAVSERGVTALVSSHELELVSRHADRVLCLNRRLLCSGPPSEVFTAENLGRLFGQVPALYVHRHGRPEAP